MTDAAPVTLDPTNPSSWADISYEQLFTLSREQIVGPQLAAMQLRFRELRGGVAALDTLATKQGVDGFDSFERALPVFFDHRVYKAYPLSLIEKGQFARLTAWLDRLTTHDLKAIPLDGVTSVDTWLETLDAHGMIIGHSTGTTGKLSFIPRSQAEWPAWQGGYFNAMVASQGVDVREVLIPNLSVSGYRSGHQMMTKMSKLFADLNKGGDANRHMLYDYAISSDLLSLAARMQAAEERGELDQLEIDPRILEDRKQLIERSRHRETDMVTWFTKAADEFRGQRVRIGGTSSDLLRVAMACRAAGVVCEFAPGSYIVGGGGMKGYQDAPDDWEDIIKDFYGVDRIASTYGMSEVMGMAPVCAEAHYHFLPYTIPIVLDADAEMLPTEGATTGRLALFDVLAQTYWGGFISGDQVTVHWDDDCPCGWKGAYVSGAITRFAEMEGGDDKITCAGTAKAYNEFMDYVSGA